MYSFVDYFTIPPSFVSIYLQRTWIGKWPVATQCWLILDYHSLFPFSFFLPFSKRRLSTYDRSPFFKSASSHDRSRHFTIFKCTKNIEFDTFGSTSIHIYIRLVNSRWYYTLGMCKALIDVTSQISNRNHLFFFASLSLSLSLSHNCSWKIRAIHWISKIHNHYHIGRASIF